VQAEIGRKWDNVGAQAVHDAYTHLPGQRYPGVPVDPGIAAFAAAVTRSSNVPASYVNAASVSR